MKSDSKRCPIESSLVCDIVDECNPVKGSESGVYVASLHCPYLKFKAERELREVDSLPKCSIRGCGRRAVVSSPAGYSLCRFHAQLASRVSKSPKLFKR